MNLETLIDQMNTNKSKTDNVSMISDLNFDNAIKDTSIIKNQKDESTNSTQQTNIENNSKSIKDDLFVNKNSEISFRKIIATRRNTNSTVEFLSFKNNSGTPVDKKLKLPAQMSFNLKKQELLKQTSSKRILPQIPENELKLPTQKSFKLKKNSEDNSRNPSNSPERKSPQPKIFIEIPKVVRSSNEKELNSGTFSNKVKENQSEGSFPDSYNGKEGNLMDKNKIVIMTKNSMIFNNHLLHFNRKKHMNILEQFFYAIKNEKMNELEELFFMYPNIFIDGRDDENNTMLINASRVGNLPMINLILSKGPNLNLRNNEGNTALHYSLAYGYDNITNKLLGSGAQENIKNNEGKRPWDMVTINP